MDSEFGLLMVVANKDFRDEEYVDTKSVFEENGIGAKVAASESDDCLGVGGLVISPDYTFDEINVDQFDGIVFIGGQGVESYFTDDLVLQLARDFAEAGKLTCAICWAPVILARAGVLKGRKVTAWSGCRKDLEAAGAMVTEESVTVDDNIITASGPESALDFGRVITTKLIG